MNCFCILEINPLSVPSFASIFSHCEGCLFILLRVSFAMQKLLSLNRSHLLVVVYLITCENVTSALTGYIFHSNHCNEYIQEVLFLIFFVLIAVLAIMLEAPSSSVRQEK